MKILITLVIIISTTLSAKNYAYIVSDISIPFWKIMSKGVEAEMNDNGGNVTIYSANNNIKQEIVNTIRAVEQGVDGVVLSPCTSTSAKTVLEILEKKNIPVVIADIGSVSNNYISYISSNNIKGSYELGSFLAQHLVKHSKDNGTVGIIAIPQKRDNGRARTKGFLTALKNYNIKSAGLRQQVTFTEDETYILTKELIIARNDVVAIWLQGSDKYKGTQRAIKESGKDIILLTFDAEPEFIQMIASGELLASAMQQPYFIGRKAVMTLNNHLSGKKVDKEIKVDTIVATKLNILKDLNFINKNVLGIER